MQLQKPLESLQTMMKNNLDREEGRDLSYPDWVELIKEKLKRASEDTALSSTKNLCIYRVPQRLREIDEQAYTPWLVSLGPYHHGNPQLGKMESQKWRILDHVLKRKNQDVSLYLDAITEIEEEVRSCYEGKIDDLSKNQFVEMMVLDGIFVLEFLQGAAKEQGFKKLGYSLDDVIFSNPGTIWSILEDMIKLENQLPLLVLDPLLGLQLENQNVTGEVAKLIPYLFRSLMPTIGIIGSSSSYKGDQGDLETIVRSSSNEGNLETIVSFLPKPELVRCSSSSYKGDLGTTIGSSSDKGNLETEDSFLVCKAEPEPLFDLSNKGDLATNVSSSSDKGDLEIDFLVGAAPEPLFDLSNKVDLATNVSSSSDKGNLEIDFLVGAAPEPLFDLSNKGDLGINGSSSLNKDKGDLHCLDVFRKNLLEGSESEKANDFFNAFQKFKIALEEACQKLKMIVLEKVFYCLATKVARGEFVHCATELQEAGVKFKKRETNLFWDITFKNGILEIPQLKIYDSTKLLFLNLIAFEQCHSRCEKRITSYASFMDSLINSEQDVVYLHKHKIIEHWLSNDAEVANLFNDLCKKVNFDNNNSYLSSLSYEVNQYSNHKCNAWGASLKQKYFSNPWSVISLLAALVLLVLTVLQTIYAGKDYYHP